MQQCNKSSNLIIFEHKFLILKFNSSHNTLTNALTSLLILLIFNIFIIIIIKSTYISESIKSKNYINIIYFFFSFTLAYKTIHSYISILTKMSRHKIRRKKNLNIKYSFVLSNKPITHILFDWHVTTELWSVRSQYSSTFVCVWYFVSLFLLSYSNNNNNNTSNLFSSHFILHNKKNYQVRSIQNAYQHIYIHVQTFEEKWKKSRNTSNKIFY